MTEILSSRVAAESTSGLGCPMLRVTPGPRSLVVKFDPGAGDGRTIERVHYVDDESFADIRRGAAALLRGPHCADIAREARTVGHLLYRALLPDAVREELATLRGPLSICDDGLSIPWELVHDGREFWAVAHAIGRIGNDRPAAPKARRPAGQLRVLVVGADPSGLLPFIEEELDQLWRLFEPLGAVTRLSGAGATNSAVRGLIGERFDIVHVCGAARSGENGLELLLAGDKTVGLAALAQSFTGNPLVVLDLCEADRGISTPDQAAWSDRTAQAARAWLAVGALGVVSPITPAADRHRARLIEQFYRHTLEGVAFGEALRAARAEARAEAHRSPAWLSCVLHGHPAAALPTTLVRIRPSRSGSAVRIPLAPALPPRRSVLSHIAAVAVMLLLGVIGWGLFHRQPLRVEIVRGESVEDPVFQTAARDAPASLRDALWRLGRGGQHHLEVVPPRQALCDGTSAARCFQLLPTARPAHRVVVTPVRPVDGGYLVELRAAGFGPSGEQLFDAHVAGPPDRAEKLSAELLSAVLN